LIANETRAVARIRCVSLLQVKGTRQSVRRSKLSALRVVKRWSIGGPKHGYERF
jgi:hypothetical protein